MNLSKVKYCVKTNIDQILIARFDEFPSTNYVSYWILCESNQLNYSKLMQINKTLLKMPFSN